jgi:hypothetical protein
MVLTVLLSLLAPCRQCLDSRPGMRLKVHQVLGHLAVRVSKDGFFRDWLKCMLPDYKSVPLKQTGRLHELMAEGLDPLLKAAGGLHVSEGRRGDLELCCWGCGVDWAQQ